MEQLRKKITTFLLFIAVVLFTSQNNFADDKKDEASSGVSKKAGYLLSLEEATRLAIKNNFDIQLAQYDAQIAKTKQGVAESIYDTILAAEFKYHNDQRKKTSTLLGTKTVDNDYNVAASKKAPTGTTLSVDMNNNRHWTDSSFAALSPSHDSSLGLTVEQELGKNFLGIQDRGGVKVTQFEIENLKYTSLDKIETTLAETQMAYWDLVFAYKRVEIAQGMLKQAQDLYDLHQQKMKDGLVEIPEAYASEANYKKRVNELLVAENQAKIKSNILKILLSIEDDAVSMVPTDHFSVRGESEQKEQSLKLAFENRRDYKVAANDIKSRNIDLSMKKNDLWPEINLTASLVRNGVADHFKSAIEQISDEDNPDFFAGIIFNLPLENTKAKSELKSSELQKAKALIAFKLLERRIAIGIIDAVRTCNVLRERMINAEEIARLQEQKFSEEEKRFQRGRSNTDTIIRYQEDLIEARWQAVEAARDYQYAKIGLRQEENSLLSRYWQGEI